MATQWRFTPPTPHTSIQQHQPALRNDAVFHRTHISACFCLPLPTELFSLSAQSSDANEAMMRLGLVKQVACTRIRYFTFWAVISAWAAYFSAALFSSVCDCRFIALIGENLFSCWKAAKYRSLAATWTWHFSSAMQILCREGLVYLTRISWLLPKWEAYHLALQSLHERMFIVHSPHKRYIGKELIKWWPSISLQR